MTEYFIPRARKHWRKQINAALDKADVDATLCTVCSKPKSDKAAHPHNKFCKRLPNADAVAMPGNNLQAKLFLSVTGGDPPDLVNQDDPVLADWAARGVIQPIASVATTAQVDQLDQWLFEPARRLSKVNQDLSQF